MTSTLTKLVTYDDYRELPDDGNQYQIIGGELYKTAAPFSRHQQTVRNIFRVIDKYVVKNDLGETYFAPFDVVLSMTDVVEPDIFFIANDRLQIITEKNIVAAPDFIVEVLSDSTKHIDRVQKKELYENHEVKEYWIADPDQELIEQYVLEEGALALKTTAKVQPSTFQSHLFEELHIDCKKIFNFS